MSRSDVVVVGGGPAGLAVAIAARLRNLTVTVVERSRPPIDKACGEGLMPDGVELLERWGVSLSGARATPFAGIRYVDGEVVAEAAFPRTPGLGIRRPDLHQAMSRRAQELGVDLRWQTRVSALAPAPAAVETCRGTVEGNWLVGADGLHSRVRRWAGLEAPAGRSRRFGVRRHFAVERWTRHVEVHWGAGCEAYVTPVADRETGVAFLWSDAKADFDSLLERFPALKQRLAGAAPASRDRGAGPFDQRTRSVARGRIALVGDAAGYRDAITGEGLALCFQQAELLVDALQANDLARYRRAFGNLVALPFRLIALLLFAERHPRVRRRLVRLLASDPALFARLLAIHVRERPPSDLGWRGAWLLTRCLLPGTR